MTLTKRLCSQHALLAVSLTSALIACAGAGERSVDSATTQIRRDTPTVRALSGAELVSACREAAVRESPKVRWAVDTALTADVNYDGSPELIVWGTEGDSVFVLSMVECAGVKSGRVWSMPPHALERFETTDLEVVLEDPALGDGYLFETCTGAETTSECRHLFKLNKELAATYVKGGRGLSVGVEDRDHVHIYWDPGSKSFVSWSP